MHPRAQSRLVEFLAYVSNLGLQVILETHSDHIYNGLRKCIKKEKISKDKAAIYFLELDETMQDDFYQALPAMSKNLGVLRKLKIPCAAALRIEYTRYRIWE